LFNEETILVEKVLFYRLGLEILMRKVKCQIFREVKHDRGDIPQNWWLYTLNRGGDTNRFQQIVHKIWLSQFAAIVNLIQNSILSVKAAGKARLTESFNWSRDGISLVQPILEAPLFNSCQSGFRLKCDCLNLRTRETSLLTNLNTAMNTHWFEWTAIRRPFLRNFLKEFRAEAGSFVTGNKWPELIPEEAFFRDKLGEDGHRVKFSENL
jgi:hypothetical protein